MVLPLFVFFSVALLMPMQWLDTQRKKQMELEQLYEELSLAAYITEMDAGEDLTFQFRYREKVPFFQRLTGGVTMNIFACRRPWVGLNGKLRGEKESEPAKEQETMVYVGSGMGRYHVSRSCHYISNEYRMLTVRAAKELRTSDGHRITACSVCARTSSENDVVYLTPEGRHYHCSTSCRSMTSYVREVPLSEVRHLGACSYCGGR